MNIIKTNVPQDPLQAALMQNAQLNSQLQGANMLTHPDANNGWGGGLGILAAALGGYMQNKKGKELAANEYDINQQIAAFQAQKQQEMAAAEQAKADAEYKRKMQEKEAERKFELEKQENKARLDAENDMRLRQFDVNNRQPQRMTPEQEWIANLSPEQRNVLFTNKHMPQNQNPNQGLIDRGAVTQAEIDQAERKKVLGIKDPSDSTKQKLGFIRNAREKLAEYKAQAFDESGDYKEVGSKFGNTNNLLLEAVRNKLRAESGASISDQEAESEMSLFQPGFFRTDETNLSKIKELENTLALFEKNLIGSDPQLSQMQNQANAAGSQIGDVLGAANDILKRRGFVK